MEEHENNKLPQIKRRFSRIDLFIPRRVSFFLKIWQKRRKKPLLPYCFLVFPPNFADIL